MQMIAAHENPLRIYALFQPISPAKSPINIEITKMIVIGCPARSKYIVSRSRTENPASHSAALNGISNIANLV